MIASARRGTASRRTAAGCALLAALTTFFGTPSSVSAAAVPAPPAPLPGAFETNTAAWAVVPMGQLSDPHNTFWQVLRGQPGSSRWSVVTPSGVADNGGLAVSAAGPSVLAGFLPSGLLHFSPLSASADDGTTWNPVYLPGALPPRPDALAVGPPPTGALAVVGTNVLRAPPTLSNWSRLVSLSTLGSVAGASGCRPGALDAVSFTSTTAPLVATSCRGQGRVGLFTRAVGRWHPEPVSLGGRLRASATSVIALSSSGAVPTALVVATGQGRSALIGMWQSASGQWRASPPLEVPSGASVQSTAMSAGGSIAVLLASRSGGGAVHQISDGGPWVTLPRVPAGTVAVASTVPPGSAYAAIDADVFVVHGAELDIFALTPEGSKWVPVQVTQVPLAYGSSG